MHLGKLIEQAVDFLHLNTGPCGDAALAGGFDQIRMGALARRHAVDDALLAVHFFFRPVEVNGTGLGGQLRGQFVHHAGQATHLLHLLQLGQKVVQVKAGA